jgi:hypothetical protein
MGVCDLLPAISSAPPAPGNKPRVRISNTTTGISTRRAPGLKSYGRNLYDVPSGSPVNAPGPVRELILFYRARGRHRYGVTRGFHWRLMQMDYLMTRFGGGSQNNFRFSTGILIKF